MNPVAEVLRGIAQDIETHGHYQEPKNNTREIFSSISGKGKCCLIANPTSAQIKDFNTFSAARDAMEELSAQAGFDPETLVQYSDATPTEKLISDLRRKADDLDGCVQV